MELNGYDLFLLAMVASFTILGLYWGLIRQVLSVAGLVVGIILAGRLGPGVAAWLSSFVESPQVAGILGFIIVLVGVSAAASIIASVLRVFVGLLFLGWADHILGAVLGLVQAVIAGAVLTVALVAFPDPRWSALVAESRVGGLVVALGGWVTGLLPELFQRAFSTIMER